MALRIFKGTRSPSLTDTLTVDGAPFDLTGSTVAFKMRPVGSATTKVNAAAVVVSAAAGAVRYDWQTADLDTAGDYLGWWEVTLPGGNLQDHPEFAIEVQDHARTSGHLCEVADVRSYLQIASADRVQDTIISDFIGGVSRLFADDCQREFTLTGTATRTFRAEGSFIDLAPYDLQSATLVTDTTVGGSAATLAAGEDYDLDGPYLGGTYLYLRRGDGWTRPTGRFGYSRIAITGTWGMAEIPPAIRQAAIVTVGLWMRREVQAFSSTFSLDTGFVERPRALPTAVRDMLAPYRRVTV